jgi:ABC-type glycerol-3-phosphate transport system substrate-binding protein
MKKLIMAAVVLVLGSSLVFAGGNRQQAGGGGGGGNARTVIRLGIWPEDIYPDDIALHQGYVRQFNQRYPDITVQPAQYSYAVDTFVPMAEAGQVPTIFSSWYTEPPKLIGGGFVRDITDEMRALGWDTKMEDSVKALLTRDGRLYGFPVEAYSLGLHLNVDLFREAGLVDANGLPLYPKTWEELATTAQTIKQKTGNAGLVLLAKDNAGGWHFSNIAWCFGAEFQVQQNGRWIARLNSPEVVEAMNYVRDLKWRYDVLTSDPTSEDWSSGYQKIGTGLAAMYMGAQDGVSQPTYVNGLPIEDLSLVPIPAGPRGQYGLMGGNIFMFSKNATSDEVTAALHYIEIMGRAPVVTETSIAGLRAGAENNKRQGIPNVPNVPAWNDAAYLKAVDDARDAFANVDMRLYNDFYTAVKRPGYLRPEEPMLVQDMYAELTKVLQAVFTDRNANVRALLDTAQQNFQRLLDSQVNN